MSQNYLLLIALLSGIGLGIVIQIGLNIYEVIKDPDKFEKDAARLLVTVREFRRRIGK